MAPVVGWLLMLSIYFGWLAAFAVIWIGFVWLMRRHSTIVQKPALAPNPFPAPPPAVPATPKPIPVAQKIEIHPNHTLLPMIAELDLPAPLPRVPAPSKVEVPAPKAAPAVPITIVTESQKSAVTMPNLEESGLAALNVMPKRPEDIESSKRGPVVKMSDEI